MFAALLPNKPLKPPPLGFCAIQGFDLTLISQLHNLFSSITEFLKLRNRNASVKKPAQRRRASRINLTCCSDAEERKGKSQNEHTCFGVVVVF
jgi:hypothetical protein